MKKIRLTLEISDENFEVLMSEDPANFDDPSELIWQLKELVATGDFESLSTTARGVGLALRKEERMKEKILRIRDLVEETHVAKTDEERDKRFSQTMSELADAWSDATQMSGNQMLATFEEGTDRVHVELFKDGKSLGDAVETTTTKLAEELVKNTKLRS